ncbi:hypothetical protein [Lactobacillus sp. LL6]|uniref:hypothetical protein n=1 Tax=Lactobacillus sp. LL6 TaxID=2596827 RepID=UPI001185711A|nr:hypothetical protein [Lactobacillus sp. LL6]TSO26688.1 hypothetical protein FOD82_06400 [Lactobacillus sp. LL6]
MKKAIVSIIAILGLTACSSQNNNSKNHTNSSKVQNKVTQIKEKKIDTSKKYPGLSLMTIPSEFRGNWYRSDEFSKSARKLVITKHLVNDSVVYQKTGNIKLDHNSEKQNKQYAGNISIGKVDTINGLSSLRIRDVLGSVDIIYMLGTFKGHQCLFLAYDFGDREIHGVLFKKADLAVKYRKYDFSKLK